MRRRSRIITKIIVFALIVYAGITLISLRGRIDDAREDLFDTRRRVAEEEVSNARREYQNKVLEDRNDPDYNNVVAEIAREYLGLVNPGEIVFHDGGSEPEPAD